MWEGRISNLVVFKLLKTPDMISRIRSYQILSVPVLARPMRLPNVLRVQGFRSHSVLRFWFMMLTDIA